MVEIGTIDGVGRSPLHDGSLGENIEIARCLLEFGADPNIQGVPLFLVSLLILKRTLQMIGEIPPFTVRTTGGVQKLHSFC